MSDADLLVQKWLAAAVPGTAEEDGDSGMFDPWFDLGLYGSYSSAFDDLAIAVLTDMRDQTFIEQSLAGEIFRELLCVKDLCEYGTSPRCCWPRGSFRNALPTILQKLEALRAIRWPTVAAP